MVLSVFISTPFSAATLSNLHNSAYLGHVSVQSQHRTLHILLSEQRVDVSGHVARVPKSGDVCAVPESQGQDGRRGKHPSQESDVGNLSPGVLQQRHLFDAVDKGADERRVGVLLWMLQVVGIEAQGVVEADVARVADVGYLDCY